MQCQVTPIARHFAEMAFAAVCGCFGPTAWGDNDNPATPAAAPEYDMRLYSRCRGMFLDVRLHEGAVLGLSDVTVRNAVESRLRAARLLKDVAPDKLVVMVAVRELRHHESRALFGSELHLMRMIEDDGMGRSQQVGVWSISGFRIASRQGVLGYLSEQIDHFINEYLKANGTVCRMRERNDFDGLLRLEGRTLSHYRSQQPNKARLIGDDKAAKDAWERAGTFRIGLAPGEFCRQFHEIPKGEDCPVESLREMWPMSAVQGQLE